VGIVYCVGEGASMVLYYMSITSNLVTITRNWNSTLATFKCFVRIVIWGKVRQTKPIGEYV
jgi:hypothetical protein